MKDTTKPYAAALLAVGICLLVYLRALSCGFVNYDDPEYVLNNPLIRSFDANMIVQAFRQPHLGWWMPLTWISFALDYRFWGLNPFGYHLTNILLHAVNTGLVVMIADKVLKVVRGSTLEIRSLVNADSGNQNAERDWLYPATLLLAGLLWGIHPLRVESVAWVTERKDVLNGVFTLSAVLAYLSYVKRKESGVGTWFSYLFALVLFACSLLAKSISVVLPFMLLVLDRYPLGRLRSENIGPMIVEKLPFFGLSAIMTIITVSFAGSSGFVVLISNEMFPWHERLLVSGNAVLQYIRYLVLPAGIVPYHIIPDPVPLLNYTFSTILIAVISVVLLWSMRDRLWVGSTWLLFVIPLLPVLSFLQNGDQGYAARFTYLPTVAPCILAAALFRNFFGGKEGRSELLRRMVAVSVVLLLAGCAAMSYRLITYWDDGGTMWTRVIEHDPSSAAYWRRALYHYTAGNYRAAGADYTAAIDLVTPTWRPHLHNLYAHRGESAMAVGAYEYAVNDLTTALLIYPHPQYFRLRSEALRMLGRESEAEADMMRAGNAHGPLEWYFESLPETVGR